MRALVTGGSGFVGRRLVSALVSRGHSVSVLARSPTSFPEPVAVIVGDLTAKNGIGATVLSGHDVIFHCAGEKRNQPLMRKLHVEGTQRLLELLRGPIHWVQLSSISVYGHSGPRSVESVVTEETPGSPVGEYETTKAESDQLVMTAAKLGMTYTILRPTGIIGREMTDQSLRTLVQVVRKGLFFYVGSPGAVAGYVHVDDVVDALLKCGTEPRACGQIFNLSNDCPFEELVDGIAQAAGVRKPRLRIPEGLARLCVTALSPVFPLPLTSTRIDALVNRTRYPATKIQRELSFSFRHPVPEAIGELVN